VVVQELDTIAVKVIIQKELEAATDTWGIEDIWEDIGQDTSLSRDEKAYLFTDQLVDLIREDLAEFIEGSIWRVMVAIDEEPAGEVEFRFLLSRLGSDKETS